MPITLKVRIGERWYAVEIDDLESDPVRVLVDGTPVEVSLDRITGSAASVASFDGPAVAAEFEPPSPEGQAAGPSPQRPTPRPPRPSKVFRVPMPGVVLSVAVKVGDQVVTGDEVCVLEAMKMHQSLRADWTGVVQAVHVSPGEQVLDGDPIVELG